MVVNKIKNVSLNIFLIMETNCQYLWKAECSWAHVTAEELKKTCTASDEDAGIIDLEVDDITSLETCSCLNRQEAEGLPEVTITADGLLKRVDIVSEAKIVEVFRGGGQYLATCRSEFVDDWEGMAVYYTKILVPTSERSLTFKFTRMKCPDRLWIYGIRLQLAPVTSEAAALPSNPESHSASLPPEVPSAMLALTKRLEQLAVQKELLNGSHSSSAHPSIPQAMLSSVASQLKIKCEDCEKCSLALVAFEDRLNSKLTMMEGNIMAEIQKQNEQLLNDIKSVVHSQSSS